MKNTPVKTNKKKTTPEILPPVRQLFIEAWEMLKEGILNAVFFMISYYAASFFIFLFMMIIAVLLSIPHFGAIQNAFENPLIGQNIFWILPSSYYWSLGILTVVMITLGTIVAYMYQAGIILSLGEAEEKSSFGSILSRSLNLVPKIFLLGLTMFFLVFGGYMFFAIPALIITVLMAFSYHELILGKKGVMESINSSFYLVSKNFGAVFGRYALFMLAYLIISMIPNILGAISDYLTLLYSPVSFAVSIFLPFFSIAFMIALYKQVKAITPEKKAEELKTPVWAWVVASFGWVFFIMFMVAISAGVKMMSDSGQFSEMFNEVSDEFVKEMTAEFETDTSYDFSDTAEYDFSE